MPILLVHGTQDDVVPYEAMKESDQILRAAGFGVTSITCPAAGHTIDDTGLAEGLKFLKTHLP
jgi:phospholipase/carboxylesterase